MFHKFKNIALVAFTGYSHYLEKNIFFESILHILILTFSNLYFNPIWYIFDTETFLTTMIKIPCVNLLINKKLSWIFKD